MNAIATPKIFVSYSWSSPEHEQWVLDLCHSLNNDGIEILLDKWDLREGDDSISFMERMVNDPTITKIIMVIDNKYTEKANARSGGVGTESTILSTELYSKRNSNNIVAVIAEPGCSKPTFYASRIHIDLSQSERYAEEYENLVRWAYDKYKHERPKNIGKPPSFISMDDSLETLHTNTEFRIALEAIEKGRSTASGNVKSYLSKLNSELSKLSINNQNRDQIKLAFENNLKNFQPYLLEFEKIADAVCSHPFDPKIHKHFRYFFEALLKHLTLAPNGESRFNADFEFFEFIIYQMFLSYVAILLKNEEFTNLKELLDEVFVIPPHYRSGYHTSPHSDYCIFRNQNTNMIDHEIMKNKISPLGAMLKGLNDENIITFSQIIEADFFLYLKSIIRIVNGKQSQVWWPHTNLYLNYKQESFRIFLKSEKQSYFDEIKNVLGVENLSFIEKICPDDNDWTNRYIPKWQDHGLLLNLKSLTNYAKLEPLKRSTMEIS